MGTLYSLNIKSIVQIIYDEGWAFIFICLYLFFEYVRPQTIYPGIDVIPWVPWLLGFATIFFILEGDYKGFSNVLSKLMVLYGLIVLLSCAFSQYSDLSFARWRVFFDWFVIYFLIVLIVNNEKRFFIFLFSFLLYSFKMSQHGLRAWASKGFGFDEWGVNGPPGWFQNSGELSIQMCIFVPLCIAFIIAIFRYIPKLWFIFLVLMPFTGMATIVASSSRGAMIGIALAGIRPLTIRPRIFIQSLVVLFFLGVLIFHAIPEGSKQRFENSGSDRTSLHRIERWKDGIDAMSNFPLFGIGFEVWSEYYSINYELEDTGSLLVHNIFIQCGSEIGYSGLCVFLFMIIACFTNTSKVRKCCKGEEDQFLTIMSYGFDAALLGFIGSGFFVTVLYYPYFWIHCAMTVSLTSVAEKKYC